MSWPGSPNLQPKLLLKPVKHQLTKRTVQKFASRRDLVYFGYVNQRNDEHKLVRGMSVSTNHTDNHYCIGTFQGYDITFVKRSDTIRFHDKPSKPYTLLIMTFDLHRLVDLPHIFLGLRTYSYDFYSHLFTKFVHLNSVGLSVDDGYSEDFLQSYGLYSSPSQLLSAQRLFPPDITEDINNRFNKFSFEISEGCLYVYADENQPSQDLLDKMLKAGLWLSSALDKVAAK